MQLRPSALSPLRFLLPTILFGMLGVSAGWTQDAKPTGLPNDLVFKSPVIPESVEGEMRRLNETLSKGIDPQDNAAILLLHVLGESAFDPELADVSLEMLGIDTMSTTVPEVQAIEPYVESLATVAPADRQREALMLQEQIFVAAERPWTAEEFPKLAAFMEANEAALNVIVTASGMPRYYFPMLSEEKPQRLMSASLSLERRLPFLVRMLCARAMHRAAQNEMPAATADFLAGHKLALLLATGSPFDVSVAKAHTMDAFVCRAASTLLSADKYTPEFAAPYAVALETLPRMPRSHLAADVGERAILHREIELLRTDDPSLKDFFEIPGDKEAKPIDKARLSDLKWELAIEQADVQQDAIVKALETADRSEQAALFKQLDVDFKLWEQTSDDRLRTIAESIDKNLDEASRWVGESMAMSLRPLYWQRRATDDRADVRRDLLRIGLALMVYRGEHGEYPETLASLAPKLLKEIPLDAPVDAPFRYVRFGPDHAVVTSLGTNREDDANKPYNDDTILELKPSK